ncbi:heme ABC exporter ATP-binding protein CcmA [Parerythrobacter jejuensis]
MFRKFDLSLHAGDTLHITGANGIGKSSLMRILAGLLRPFEGTVNSTGSLALMDERLALDPEWPLGRSLAFWHALDGCTDPSDALAMMDIEPLLDVPVRFLSTGQRKRAAFARLLSGSADNWLLDEPFNGLDAAARDKVIARIRHHCEAGGICVIASHQDLGFKAPTLAIEDYAT